MNPGSRRDHDKFCRTEGWEEVRNARGQSVRHHITYELALDDGRILRTRISRPANSDVYGPALWKQILSSTQLDVSEDDFWACVRGRVKPARSLAPDATEGSLPAGLVHQLLSQARVPEDVVRTMSLDEAIARMDVFWSTGG